MIQCFQNLSSYLFQQREQGASDFKAFLGSPNIYNYIPSISPALLECLKWWEAYCLGTNSFQFWKSSYFHNILPLERFDLGSIKSHASFLVCSLGYMQSVKSIFHLTVTTPLRRARIPDLNLLYLSWDTIPDIISCHFGYHSVVHFFWPSVLWMGPNGY